MNIPSENPSAVQTRRPASSLSTLSSFEQRIINRLAKGGRLHFEPSGHAKLGPITVPASIIDRFIAQDLLDVTLDDARLSSVGAAFATRMKSTNRTTTDEDVFANQHRDMVTEHIEIDQAKQKVRVNRSDSPLWWLRARRDKNGKPLISDLQFAAGERLRQDWEMSQLGPKICMSWTDTPPQRDRSSAPEARDLPPGAFRAKERVHAALAYCGEGLGDVLIRVCCREEGLTEAESAMNWPRRSGKLILGFGLERLVDFYGMRSGRR
ncbi:MAG: DUF6456 domain-containing protein [Pseudomonadota bacterium]